MRKPLLVAASISALVVLVGWKYLGKDQAHGESHAGAALAEVKVPDLTETAKAGEALFNENCAVCHGINAAGVDGAGPPLVHMIYEPNHHADVAFYMAAKQGARAHHWRFGDMQPVPVVTEVDVAKIIAYVRELQRANGIR